MNQTLSFRLVSENKLCETTNTICKSISLSFGVRLFHSSNWAWIKIYKMCKNVQYTTKSQMCVIYIMWIDIFKSFKCKICNFFVLCDNIIRERYPITCIWFMEDVLLLTIQILQRYNITLSEDGVKVVEGNGTDYEYQIYSAGIYIVTEVKGLLNLIWDNKTSLMLQLHPKLKVCIS